MTVRVARALPPIVLSFVTAVALAACQAIQQLPAEVGLAPAPLVVLEMSGGRCVEGTCTAHASLDTSGRLVHIDGSESTIAPERVARIVESIASTDWAAVMAKPFEGECPTAFDGSELTWTIQAPPGPVEIADCSVAVDYDSDPFRALRDEFFIIGG